MINLLPPEEKRELSAEKKRRIVIILWILVLFFLFSLFLTLLLAKIYLQTQVLSQKSILLGVEKESPQPEIEDFRGRITLINQNLTDLKTFYERKVYFPKVLERISQILPQGIYLTNFSALLSAAEEKPIVKVSLTGFSPSREILFEFKQNLEREKDFQNVYFPPINWVKPANIDFLITFEIR